MVKLRIGVLLTEGLVEAEKEELVTARKRIPPRPWVKHAPADLVLDRPANSQRRRTIGIPTDVSVGEYIKFTHSDMVDVDYIHPKDITVERMKSNSINFLLIYDLLEAFHIDKTHRIFEQFKYVLNCADNIFPNLEFQQFVNSKLLYYNHFVEQGVPIAPTITISKEEWDSSVEELKDQGGASAVAMQVLEKIQRKGFKKFIGKPVYGQESRGCGRFLSNMTEREVERFTKFLRATFDKYPGLIIQEFITDFGYTKDCPELRMYFVGDEYQYTAIATKEKNFTLKEDGYAFTGPTSGVINLPAKVDIQKMRQLADKAIKSMPPVVLGQTGRGVVLPRLLTRVDMGCIRGGVFDPWVNEIEFVPALYIEDHKCPIDAHLGEQMVEIAKQFVSSSTRCAPMAGGVASPSKKPGVGGSMKALAREGSACPKMRRIERLYSNPLSILRPLKRKFSASHRRAIAANKVSAQKGAKRSLHSARKASGTKRR